MTQFALPSTTLLMAVSPEIEQFVQPPMMFPKGFCARLAGMPLLVIEFPVTSPASVPPPKIIEPGLPVMEEPEAHTMAESPAPVMALVLPPMIALSALRASSFVPGAGSSLIWLPDPPAMTAPVHAASMVPVRPPRMALSGALVVLVLPPRTTARVAVLAMACEAPANEPAFVAPVMVFDAPPTATELVQLVSVEESVPTRALRTDAWIADDDVAAAKQRSD